MRGTRKPTRSPGAARAARISAASSGVTRSSASTETIQSCAARPAAKFFCALYPSKGRVMTVAPRRAAMAAVSSALPESMTSRSSAHATECRQASRWASPWRVCTRSVWGPAQADNGHYLRIYMGHLRHKLEDDPAQPQYLVTETAVGYRLQIPA